MLNDFGNSEVTIKKEELLTAIKKNRETHHEFFLKAQVGYRAAAIAELESMLKTARENGKIKRKLELVEPQNHTREYDRVIRMLEMSTADEWKISERQFTQYVLDEWSWSADFLFSNTPYTS